MASSSTPPFVHDSVLLDAFTFLRSLRLARGATVDFVKVAAHTSDDSFLACGNRAADAYAKWALRDAAAPKITFPWHLLASRLIPVFNGSSLVLHDPRSSLRKLLLAEALDKCAASPSQGHLFSLDRRAVGHLVSLIRPPPRSHEPLIDLVGFALPLLSSTLRLRANLLLVPELLSDEEYAEIGPNCPLLVL